MVVLEDERERAEEQVQNAEENRRENAEIQALDDARTAVSPSCIFPQDVDPYHGLEDEQLERPDA